MISCEDQIVSECDIEKNETTVAAKFSAIQNEILTPKCAISGCHVSNTGLPVFSAGQAYNNLKNVMSSNPPFPFVYPSRSDSSYIISKLRGIDIQGERMPLNRQPLSASIIDSIAAWIDNGALNN
jgi:hypothetical protein